MAQPKASIKITGDKELLKLLKNLPEDKSVRAAVRKSVNAGAQVILKAARTKAKSFQRTGALARSLDKVVRTGKDKQSIYSFIGARSGYHERKTGSSSSERLKKGDKLNKGDKAVRPPLYIHLVEFGHVNPGGSFTPPKNFLRAAAAESESAAAGAFNTKLGPAIEAEAAKLAKKRRRR